VTATLLACSSIFDSVGEGATLDELVVSVWEDLSADRDVACPVCAGQMRPEYGVHARAIGGRCSACASTMH
jgi:DNA-directed RNA polymerase subunit RPC12/RpoP